MAERIGEFVTEVIFSAEPFIANCLLHLHHMLDFVGMETNRTSSETEYGVPYLQGYSY